MKLSSPAVGPVRTAPPARPGSVAASERAACEAVVFDLDGVLIDSFEVMRRAFALAYREVVGPGRPPFEAKSPYELWQKVLEVEPANANALNPGADRVMARVAPATMSTVRSLMECAASLAGANTDCGDPGVMVSADS